MVAHLFWQDVKRNLRPIRALPLLVLCSYLAYREVKRVNPLGTAQDYLFFTEGAFTRAHFWLANVIPLIAGVMGASLAAERRAGITLSVLAKGVPRSRYLLAKMLGAAASSVLVTLGAITFFFAYVFTHWHPGRPLFDPEPMWMAGPVKSLFFFGPFVHDLLCVAMLLAGSAALPLIGVLAGLLVANEYVAMAATPIGFILAVILMREVSQGLNPENYLWLDYDFYLQSAPDWFLALAPFLYWSLFSLLIAIACRFILARKEIV